MCVLLPFRARLVLELLKKEVELCRLQADIREQVGVGDRGCLSNADVATLQVACYVDVGHLLHVMLMTIGQDILWADIWASSVHSLFYIELGDCSLG